MAPTLGAKSPCTVLIQARTCPSSDLLALPWLSPCTTLYLSMPAPTPTPTSWLYHGSLTRSWTTLYCTIQACTCPYSGPLALPWLPQQVLNHSVLVQACTCPCFDTKTLSWLPHQVQNNPAPVLHAPAPTPAPGSSMAPSPATKPPCTCPCLHLPLLRPPGRPGTIHFFYTTKFLAKIHLPLKKRCKSPPKTPHLIKTHYSNKTA